jgi:hypothetical protein
MTSSESTSRKSSALGVVPGDGTDVWGRIPMNKGRVGEERRGKETDGCPLTIISTPHKPWSTPRTSIM